MDDIEALCSRIMLINHGKLLSDGSLDELRSRVTTDRWLIIDLADEASDLDQGALTVLKREGARVTLSFNPRNISTQQVIAQVTAKNSVRDLFVHNPPIEQIIAQLYTGASA